MTHTPGPWHIGMKPGPTVYGPHGEQITWSFNPLLDESEHRANQFLIAAAPEMLDALKKLMDMIDFEYPYGQEIITKAEKGI